MKNLMLIFLIVISSTFAFSQSKNTEFPLNPDTGEIYYSEVVNVKGKSKNDLFLSAETWFANSFKSSKEVIQLRDKEEGMIIGKGIYRFKKGKVNFSVKISIREERFKYEIYNLIYETSIGGNFTFDLRQEKPKGIMKSMWVSAWKDERNNTIYNIDILIASLIKEMSVNDNDW